MRSWRGVIGAAGIAVAACADPAPDAVVQPGVLAFVGTTARIEAPASVQAGQPFEVRMLTQGDPCTSFASTEVELRADGADVRPYDRWTSDDGGCILLLIEIYHAATLTFDTPGPKAVTVHGRTATGDRPVAIALTITVE